MCGIAGIISRNGERQIGSEMTRMLQSMKHRGPDSTGYALYGPVEAGYVMRVKLADANTERDYEFADRLTRNKAEIERRLAQLGATRACAPTDATEYAFEAHFDYDGDLKALADRVEDVRGAEVLSLGHSLQIVKDLGDAESVSERYKLGELGGTHAIGHVRMATESDVDISGAHPYWAYPFSDIAVVHNGQLTNYHQWKRRLERSGHRFQSECDSEIIAVYLAEKMAEGADLEDAMRDSPRGARRRVHVHLRDRRRARHGQGRAGREAARALRGRRPRRARVRGDRDPRGRRPRDRHVRPVRGGGDGVDSADLRRARPRRGRRHRAGRRRDRRRPRPSSTRAS